jgi:hypothetical protein
MLAPAAERAGLAASTMLPCSGHLRGTALGLVVVQFMFQLGKQVGLVKVIYPGNGLFLRNRQKPVWLFDLAVKSRLGDAKHLLYLQFEPFPYPFGEAVMVTFPMIDINFLFHSYLFGCKWRKFFFWELFSFFGKNLLL